jgi:predicted CXXCH cytochrome family protein
VVEEARSGRRAKFAMRKLFIVTAVVAFVFAFVPVYSQEDIMTLEDSAFHDSQRPAAVFEHDQHNEKAEIDECNVCHHLYEGGNKVEDDSSEGQGCSDCHNVEEGYPTRPLMKAYHDLCKGCHGEKDKGPVTCGECHPRQ